MTDKTKALMILETAFELASFGSIVPLLEATVEHRIRRSDPAVTIAKDAYDKVRLRVLGEDRKPKPHEVADLFLKAWHELRGCACPNPPCLCAARPA